MAGTQVLWEQGAPSQREGWQSRGLQGKPSKQEGEDRAYGGAVSSKVRGERLAVAAERTWDGPGHKGAGHSAVGLSLHLETG